MDIQWRRIWNKADEWGDKDEVYEKNCEQCESMWNNWLENKGEEFRNMIEECGTRAANGGTRAKNRKAKSKNYRTGANNS